MEQIGALDPYAVAGVAIILLLVACLAILVAMRDTRSTPAHLVTRFVDCPHRRQAAAVTFVEAMRTGIVTRRVQSCSLLDLGERCDQGCGDLPPSELRTEPNAAVTENPPASA